MNLKEYCSLFREELLCSCVPFRLNHGVDKEYGGIIYFKDILGKPVEAYEHDMKLWWPQNEAAIASLMLFKATGERKYKDLSIRCECLPNP